MTLPHERMRAVLNTREFLAALIDSKQSPKVPLEIRRLAARLLKHYPTEYDIQTSRDCLTQFSKEQVAVVKKYASTHECFEECLRHNPLLRRLITK